MYAGRTNAYVTTSPDTPAQEPVSVEECKAQMRVDIDDDDDLIAGYITAARMTIERTARLQMIQATWHATFDHFPEHHDRTSFLRSRFIEETRLVPRRARPLYLSPYPLISVQAVKYFDAYGVDTTMDPALYTVVTDGFEGAIVLTPAGNAYGSVWWPDTLEVQQDYPAVVRVDYTAGFGTEPVDVPAPLRLAIKLVVAEMYANREPVPDTYMTTVDWLLGTYRAVDIG